MAGQQERAGAWSTQLTRRGRGSWAWLIWQRGGQGGSNSSAQLPEGQSEPNPSQQCQQGSTAQVAVVPGPWEVQVGDWGNLLALEGGAALGQVTERCGVTILGGFQALAGQSQGCPDLVL